MKRPHRVGILGAGLAATALLAAGCGTGGGATGAQHDTNNGQTLFTQNCAACHTLAAANATGSVGPNLDQLHPGAATVKRQVENGGGAMPAFKGRLSQQQIDAVSQYVAKNANPNATSQGGGGTP